jgi:hypothetical protein
VQGVADRTHELVSDGLERRHAHIQGGLDRQHEADQNARDRKADSLKPTAGVAPKSK